VLLQFSVQDGEEMGLKMKKLFALLIILPLLSFSALAADTDKLLQQQMQQSGADNLNQNVPQQAKDSLNKLQINNSDTSSISKFTPAGLLSIIVQSAKDAAQRPFKAIALVIGVLLIYALLNTLKTSLGEKPLKNVFDTICMLCIAAAVIAPISQTISYCAQTIKTSGIFTLSFLPVFTGLVAVSGHPASATIYQGLLLTVCHVLIQLAETTFVPMVSIYLAFCVIGSVSPGINILGLAGFAKSFVLWGLGLCITVFVGILTIQGLISNAADNVTMKTAKFMVGSFVPVIGSAIGEALNTVVGCANLLKTATGVYAIIVFILAYLPPILECIIWMLAIDISVAIAEILAVDGMSSLLKAIKEAISIMMALVLTCSVALIISTTIMLILGMGS
jgi:stage III sporulation protein AE